MCNTLEMLHDPPSRDPLVARVRAGDAGAFAVLFKEHYRAMCALAFRYVQSWEEAEDVVETIWIKVWERREEWTVHGTAAEYLFAAVRNQSINRLRHDRIRQRAAERLLHEAWLAPAGGDPATADEHLVAAELETTIAAAIAALPARCREAFVLHRQHGRSYAEIAAVMGISVRTVEVQIGKALRLLRARVAEVQGERE